MKGDDSWFERTWSAFLLKELPASPPKEKESHSDVYTASLNFFPRIKKVYKLTTS